MNRLATVACLLVTRFIFCLPLGIALHSTTVQAVDADGTISFFGKSHNSQPGEHLCTLAFVTAKYIFNQMDECTNDEAYSFQLNGVRSATTFGFYDDEECAENDEQKFYFVMKTVKDNLTMDTRVELDDLMQYEINTIIPGTGGVRLLDKLKTGQVYGKLTCVKITRSAVPD